MKKASRLPLVLPVFAGLWATSSSAAPEDGRAATALAWRIHSIRASDALRQAEAASVEPATPADGAELRFDEFFASVVGDRGLELSARLRSLHGRRVVISGFMVREPRRTPGMFLLAPQPARVTDDGFCLFDDLPTATLHVLTGSGPADRPEPFRPGRLTLVGILDVGSAPMADGRNSYVRLRLDPTAPKVAISPSLP
jgi:hypothetical protein